MKIRILLLTVALASAALTGCIGADDTDEPVDDAGVDDTGTDSGDTGDNVDLAKKYPLPDPKTPLDVTVATSDVWIKPGTEITLTSSAPADATVRYFLDKRMAGGMDHSAGDGGEMDHSAHGGGDGGMDMIDTGDIAPGVAAEPFTLDETGWYTFHCHPHPWMKFNVTVVDGAATSGLVDVVSINDEGDETFRFYPQDLTVAPGTQIRVWNNGTVVHTVMEETRRPYLGEGASVTASPDAVGDWDVLAVATDGADGYGEARTRLVVDDAKPDPSKTWEPFSGEFTGAAPIAPETSEQKVHTFLAEWDMATLNVGFTLAGDIPPEAVLQVLSQNGDVIGESEPGAEGALALTDVAAGTYKAVLTLHQGLMTGYEITIQADFDLVPPEDYTPGGGHDDGGGHQH